MPEPEHAELISIKRAISPSGSPFGLSGTSAGHVEAGYGGAPTGEPEALVTRKPADRGMVGGRRLGAARPDRPETRAAIRTHWRAAKEAAEAMLRAARAQEPMSLCIATDNLDIALGRLWELRKARDIDWQTILNHTQGLLKQAFKAKRVEELNEEQCRRILEIVDRYLGPATKGTDDLNEVVRLIEDAGFDPYGAISGDQADPAEG